MKQRRPASKIWEVMHQRIWKHHTDRRSNQKHWESYALQGNIIIWIWMVRYLTLGNGTKGAFLLWELSSCIEKYQIMFDYKFSLAMNRLGNKCDKKVPCSWVWCLDWLDLFFKYIYICREGGRFGQMDFLFQIIDAYPFASSSCTCAWVEPKRIAGLMGTKWWGFIPSRKPRARASENLRFGIDHFPFWDFWVKRHFQGLYSRVICWF